MSWKRGIGVPLASHEVIISGDLLLSTLRSQGTWCSSTHTSIFALAARLCLPRCAGYDWNIYLDEWFRWMESCIYTPRPSVWVSNFSPYCRPVFWWFVFGGLNFRSRPGGFRYGTSTPKQGQNSNQSKGHWGSRHKHSIHELGTQIEDCLYL